MKFVHITDPHLVAPRGRLYGLDPKARPGAGVADIRRHHDDAEPVVIRGDLTRWDEAYRYFVVAMRPLPMPWVVVLVGNHERRVECLDVLASNAPCDLHDSVQGVRIALAERAQLAEVIAPARTHIRHLFLGPVHRPIAGSRQGIPFSTQRGTTHQIWSELGPAVLHLASHEPPVYAIALVTPDAVVAHFHDGLDQRARFPFGRYGVDDRAYALGPVGSSA